MIHHPPLFHSLLRPCILQILRAQGYHAARVSVVDALTDLAARYLLVLCETTAHHTAHNSTELTGLVPALVDVRLALEDCGALMGKDDPGDDTRGVDDFVDWVAGPRNREIKRVALDGDDENTDYLSSTSSLKPCSMRLTVLLDNFFSGIIIFFFSICSQKIVLKKKHSKTGEDSKYNGTVLGRGNVGDHHNYGGGDPAAGTNGTNGANGTIATTATADIVVEGGEYPSIALWREKRIEARQQAPPPTPPPGEEEDENEDDNEDEDMEDGDSNGNDNGDEDTQRRRNSRSPSSGLSSLGDRSIDEEMELEFGS